MGIVAGMATVINTWHQLKAAVAAGYRMAISISYHHPDHSNSRDISTYKWSVWSPLFKTDADAAWYDNNAKVFLLTGNEAHKIRKANALERAKKWAAEQYGVTEWAKNRLGDYVAKEINDNFPILKCD